MRPRAKGEPVACPTKETIWKAVEILGKQKLHVYQVLYYAGLTMPEGPLMIERVVNCGSTTSNLKIYHRRATELSFSVRADTSDDEILRKAKMVLDGVNLKKVHPMACCGYAERNWCVCTYSFKCPLHGEIHIGSHD